MNFEKYPWLSDLTSDEAQKAIANASESVVNTGVAIFPEFITCEALADCIRETKSKAAAAFQTDDYHNIYQLPGFDTELGENHPRNRPLNTQVASIAYDELDSSGQLAMLYESDLLVELVGAVTKQSECYHSSDPLGRCSVNVFHPSQGHAWHFDESEYSTTLMLQKPTAGGLFEFTPPIRSLRSDFAVKSVEAAMATGDSVTVLEFEPGTLSVFAGRYSLHRVTEVAGDNDRLVAVFTYSSQKGFVNSREVQRMFWGREAERQSSEL
jgi:hypothetical protein